MDAPTLKALVYREIHPIRCASTCGRKAQKALYLGDLLVEAHHPMWAWDIWEWTIGEIHDKDYDDWIGVWFNPKYVSYNDVISNGICEILGKRIDDVRHREGQGDLPPQAQDFFYYWDDFDPLEQNLYFKVDDWDNCPS